MKAKLFLLICVLFSSTLFAVRASAESRVEIDSPSVNEVVFANYNQQIPKNIASNICIAAALESRHNQNRNVSKLLNGHVIVMAEQIKGHTVLITFFCNLRLNDSVAIEFKASDKDVKTILTGDKIMLDFEKKFKELENNSIYRR